ncbi:hypothetical protein SDC9_32080 [bioreactor metagenome]|uniref:Uncharacterized protein n=1 Tax=bioreactor metagenome TaxID=1076179 RepID=A0A644V489_9ZZZZ
MPVPGDEGEPHIASRARKSRRFLQDAMLRTRAHLRVAARTSGTAALGRSSALHSRPDPPISARPAGNATGADVSSRIQRRSTLSATSRPPAARATATPRPVPSFVPSFTASILNSRLNFRRIVSDLRFPGHGLSCVSTKAAEAHHADPAFRFPEMCPSHRYVQQAPTAMITAPSSPDGPADTL